jgi:hypothetical protein
MRRPRKYRIGERTRSQSVLFSFLSTRSRALVRALHAQPLTMYGAIEWFGKIDAQLCALLNVQVATLYGSLY